MSASCTAGPVAPLPNLRCDVGRVEGEYSHNCLCSILLSTIIIMALRIRELHARNDDDDDYNSVHWCEQFLQVG